MKIQNKTESDSVEVEKTDEIVKKSESFSIKRFLIFSLILSAIIGGAILRSNIATKLDSFTYDEAYHIGSGVAYVQYGDFRLNPEHPPLVKLWVGEYVSIKGFQLTPFRVFQDKKDEREFVETEVYLQNDPDTVQFHSRTAMFIFNGLLLFLFAFAARRVFGDATALAAVLFLAIDPTVAAHLPIVMTDLPLALLSMTAVLFAVSAFRSWRTIDLVLTAVTLGLALGAKHSAVVTMAAILMIGIVTAVFFSNGAKVSIRLRRLAAVFAVSVGAAIVLWSLYFFHYSEIPTTSDEQFNRPLTAKISDVRSSVYRQGLLIMSKTRLFPRAYICGMADTIRAGAVGRAISVLAFGKLYYGKAPFYYFPGVIAAKLPLGLLLLTLIGIVLIFVRKIPPEFMFPLGGLFVFALLFLLTLISGSSYAGIRHALPLVPFAALLGSLSIYQALKRKSVWLRVTVGFALIASLVSAIPVMRPWEYFNETVGTANAYLYFNDEGIDLSLRTKEMVEYYNSNLKPQGEIPFVSYPSSQKEWESRNFDWVGRDEERDTERFTGDSLNGTFIFEAKELSPVLFWDTGKDFRNAAPIARFGNVFVFQGTFPISTATRAQSLYYRAVYGKIYVAEPDIEGAIDMLSRSVALDPTAFFAALELGNLYLKSGNREESLKAYRIAADNAPKADGIGEIILRQIERVETEPLSEIEPLRNPEAE